MKRILAIMSMATFTGLACAAETCGLTEISDGWSYQSLDINDAGVVVNSVTGDDGYDGGVYLWHSGGVASWFPDLGGDHTSANAINNNGKVAGYAEDVNVINHPVTWTDGVLTELPLLPGSSPGWGGGGKALGLNDRRGVVGFSPAANGAQHAVLWVDGKANDLNRILGSVSSVAYAINNNGQIIGWAHFADGRHEAFLYQGGTVQFLGTMDGNLVSLNDINDNGQIVGSAGDIHDSRGESRAFLWENGVFTDLGTLGGASSRAYGINIHGQVVGTSQGPNGLWIAFSWKNGVMTRIGTLQTLRYGEKSYHSVALAVNAHGRVVGDSYWGWNGYTLSTSWHWKKRC